jgi:hypothetical protein
MNHDDPSYRLGMGSQGSEQTSAQTSLEYAEDFDPSLPGKVL